MRYLPITLIILVITAQPSALWAAGGGSSGGGSVPTQQRVKKAPEQLAAERYNAGLKRRDKADKLLAEAAKRDGKARARRESKASKQFLKAIKEFEKAVAYRPDFYQAHGSLGYAYRKLGRHDESLAAYNRSLSLNPDYGQAIEYRAEAYLGLGQIEEAQEAYMNLFRRQRDLADQLMVAMNDWVLVRRAAPGDLGRDRIETFANWVVQRSELAGHTEPVGQNTTSW
jgi:tetratricopeptide (TPR) repeat protein